MKQDNSNKDFSIYACDLCGCDETIEVPHARIYTNDQAVDICKNCGFVYVKKRRSFKTIAKVWSDEMYGNKYTANNPMVLARQTYIANFSDNYLKLKGKHICDIGAGEGQFLNIAKNYGASVFGIEPSQKNCSNLKKNEIDCFQGTIEEYYSKFKTKKQFDIVFIMWTLENCNSCKNMISMAHSLLKDNGAIVVATGSRILVPFKKPLHMYLTNNFESKEPADAHAFRFSANTLKGLLSKSKFEVVHSNPYIDNDILSVIALKKETSFEWEKDNYMDVYHFFKRWHAETLLYYPPEEVLD